MKFRIILLFAIAVCVFGCSKEDGDDLDALGVAVNEKFISKILPETEGTWLITRTIENKNCDYCSSVDFIDGITYFTDEKAVSKDGIGYFLDSETRNGSLLVLSSSEVMSYSTSLEKKVIKAAGKNETFKLMDKDENGNLWLLTNNAVTNLEGNKISFPNSIVPIDFEVTGNNSFWIASADTVYHVEKSGIQRFSLTEIAGARNSTSTIYSLKADKNDSVWINISDKVFKYGDKCWKDIAVNTYAADNLKTIPFMDIDLSGKVWLAEKHYQAFTNLHYFDGTDWKSYKLNPSLENWITDIETMESGTVWVGTTKGLKKITLD